MEKRLKQRLDDLEKRVKELESRQPYFAWWGGIPPYWNPYPIPYWVNNPTSTTATTAMTSTLPVTYTNT